MQHMISCNDDDSITKVKTAKQCAHQWKSLFMIRDNRKKNIISTTTYNASQSNYNKQDTIFDCSDLIIPPSYELVNREVQQGIKRWKDLAGRTILEENGSAIGGGNGIGSTDILLSEDGDKKDNVSSLRDSELILDAATGGDKRKQRILPYNFDYTCKKKRRSSSATNNDNVMIADDVEKDKDNISSSSADNKRQHHHHQPKVISLVNPTQTLSYESELWNVFNSVRTSDELEKVYALGSGPKQSSDAADAKDDDDDDSNLVSHGLQHTFALKHNLKGWLAKYTRLDAHSLGRLRIRDCHAYPNSNSCGGVSSNSIIDSGTDQSNDINSAATKALQTTVRFEILRHAQNLKRTSGPDGNRMEVELTGTLLDLHRLIVECSLNASSFIKEDTKDSTNNNNDIHAGVFFIENRFYTCGDVGDKVGKAIMQWINGKEGSKPLPEKVAQSRQKMFGSSTSKLTPMSEKKLEDLPLRLGVRYYHMFVPPPSSLNVRPPSNLISLANESAVFVTGIHTHNGHDTTTTPIKAPIIIHDTWASEKRYTCLACNLSFATVVTVNDPLTDAPPPVLDTKTKTVHLQGTPLCSSCYRALHYKPTSQGGGEDSNTQPPLLELRTNHQPSLVFPIEEFQRMVAASTLDSVKTSQTF